MVVSSSCYGRGTDTNIVWTAHNYAQYLSQLLFIKYIILLSVKWFQKDYIFIINDSHALDTLYRGVFEFTITLIL